MGYEEARVRMRSEIGRSSVERIFETLVFDVSGLVSKFKLEVIDAEAFIEGLQLLMERLRRFAPGARPAQSRSASRRWL